MIYVFLNNGFEETEALATIDVLRRGNLPVTTVGIGSMEITGSHNITVKADISEANFDPKDMQAVLLPGGPGTATLEKAEAVQKAVKYAYDNDKYLFAICAAPSILGHLNILDGKKATCFPGYETNTDKVTYTGEPVVVDGKVITAKGAGCSIEFGLKIVEVLKSPETSAEVRSSMQCP